MLAAALQAEVAAYIDQFAGVRDEDGRRMVVVNGTAEPRTVLTSAGAVEVTAPRINDKRTDPQSGQRMRFSSAILPPWARKTPQVSEVLPLLYLHGLSSGDFVPALGQFLGTGAGLSSSTVHEADRDVEGRGRGVSDRVDLRHGQAADEDHQGARVEGRRAGDGVQAHRVRAAALADGQRTAPGRARPGRRGLRQRQARRAARPGRPPEAA
jgi:hypothetical protein